MSTSKRARGKFGSLEVTQVEAATVLHIKSSEVTSSGRYAVRPPNAEGGIRALEITRAESFKLLFLFNLLKYIEMPTTRAVSHARHVGFGRLEVTYAEPPNIS